MALVSPDINRIYYNEFDANAAQWIRNLGDVGEISQGVVDERSIKSVVGADLAGVRRAHFFAGIGGWDLALKLAGWDDSEVWTGSCPCQPYSSAGKQEGDADPRNLWPDFFRLIAERRPQYVFGEQVASAIKHGWLDRVYADLEGIGYTVGSAVLGAHSVGANHIRQRLYWGAALEVQHDARDGRIERRPESGERGVVVGRGGGGVAVEPEPEPERGRCDGRPSSAGGDVRDRASTRRQEGADGSPNHRAAVGLGEDAHGRGRGRGRDGDSPRHDGEVQATGLRAVGGVPNNNKGLEVRGEGCTESNGLTIAPGLGPWSDCRYILCTDGKARRTGARVFPLAYGLPRGMGQGGSWRKGLARCASRARVGILKGSGNAIVAHLAAEFIGAFRDAQKDLAVNGDLE